MSTTSQWSHTKALLADLVVRFRAGYWATRKQHHTARAPNEPQALEVHFFTLTSPLPKHSSESQTSYEMPPPLHNLAEKSLHCAQSFFMNESAFNSEPIWDRFAQVRALYILVALISGIIDSLASLESSVSVAVGCACKKKLPLEGVQSRNRSDSVLTMTDDTDSSDAL